MLLGVDRVFPHGSRAERRAIADHYLERVGLADSKERRPGELSQGECQRVGIARAFALAPKLLLLDEPFGMLDSLTRLELQDVLLELWSRNRKTALMVTHDVDEALYLSDRIALMTKGPRARHPRDRRGRLSPAARARRRARASRLLPAARASPRAARGRGAVVALREARTVCSFCGVGCGVIAVAEGERLVGVRGDPDHPSSRGRLCTKGHALHETVHLADRLAHPQLRAEKGGALARVSWDAATARLADALRAARGPDAIGLYLSGQLLTEDYYALNKLARAVLGTNQVDSNSRLCMSSAVSGYRRAFGVDGPPCCYDDLERADLILAVGANLAWCHPVLLRRIEAARAARGGRPRLVVVDPRRTATADVADLHLAVRPGGDATLLTGLLACIAARGGLDERYVAAHTEGFAALATRLGAYDARRVERECGVLPAQLEAVAELWCEAGAALSVWAMGVNQSARGTDTVNALTNLHLATGQLGRPGAGPFSLTGQPNAMGGREVGAMATLLAAHRELASDADRREMEDFWGCGPISAAPGRTAVELFEHAAGGGLDVLWIVATNPAVTLPDSATVQRALERTPLVVLQDVVASTDTARFADLLLPAAGWAEKAGTMTNSERRVARLAALVPPPGEALPDWRIAARVAERLGAGAAFAWPDERAVFAEHVATTAGRDCDMTGMTAERLARGPLQWPCPEGAGAGAARLYTDGCFRTPTGRARFVVPATGGPAEALSSGAPLALTTTRVRDQWHTMTRTGRVARLVAHSPAPELEVSPADAARLGVATGDRVRVASQRGAFELAARVTDAVPEGVVAAPMHWSRSFDSEALVNEATHRAIDPVSKQPELKHAAVSVARVSSPSDRGLCACRDVTVGQVEAAIEAGARNAASIERRTGAGGACGSCGPEIAGLVRRAPAAPPRPRLVVVGNGMVGHRFVETLVEQGGADRYEVVVLGEEPRPAYDRVHLSELFAGKTADDLALATVADYAERGVDLRLGERVAAIDRAERAVATEAGERHPYDVLVLATGSRAVRAADPGHGVRGVFVYRTIEDVEAIRAAAAGAARGVVIGGGLLGLEAAKALRDLGLETHVVEAAPRLMPRQVDAAARRRSCRRIEALGVHVHLGKAIDAHHRRASARPVCASRGGADARRRHGRHLGRHPPARRARDGVRARRRRARRHRRRRRAPHERPARSSRSARARSHRGMIYGLVAPGYAMADALAANLCAAPASKRERFTGADLSTKLKLLGVDVASFGDAFADEARRRATLRLSRTGARRLPEARPVGAKAGCSAASWSATRRRTRASSQLLREGDGAARARRTSCCSARARAPAPRRCRRRRRAGVCSCNNVTRGAICARDPRGRGSTTVGDVKACTRAGTGCGGCVPGRDRDPRRGARGRRAARVADLCASTSPTRARSSSRS